MIENHGVFGIEHSLYLIIYIALLIIGTVLVKKYVKTEKNKKRVLFITSLSLLICIIINRIMSTIYDINEDPTIYSWINILPHSFCSLSSFVFALAVLLGKEDNKVLHFILYLGIGGGVLTLAYPGELGKKMFWEISLFTSLLHHSIMIWLAILLLVTKSFKPTIKKWYIYPIGYAFMMMLGLFEYEVLKIPNAMNIGKPLLDDLPILSSWWGLFILSCIIIWLYEFIKEKKKNIDIGKK